MQQHLDMIKGFGASAVGFAGLAVTHSDVDRWLGTLAAGGGCILVALTIAEKIRNWNKPPGSRRRRKSEDDE